MDEKGIQLTRWEDLPLEKVAQGFTRRYITGKQEMIAQLYIAKGFVVPWHRHVNEQITYILSGALEFQFGEEGEEKTVRVIRAGEVLVIPSNLPHTAVALEDTLDVDIFSPPRQDWLDGTDAYLRNQGTAAK